MKLGYYHYFFKQCQRQNPPRHLHNIQPLLDTYLDYRDIDWKKKLCTDDGEQVLLTRTPNRNVYMLIGTRDQDIIKAVHHDTMECEDLMQQLREKDQSAGFAAYFRLNDRAIGLAATLRGPRTAALSRFVNELVKQLGAGQWRMHMQPVGTSLTLDKARAMAEVSRTSITVKYGHPLWERLRTMFGHDVDSVDAFTVIVRGKRKRNIKSIFETIAANASGPGLDQFTLRAREAVDDDLADYHVMSEGKLGEELPPGIEEATVNTIASRFAQNQALRTLISETLGHEIYSSDPIPELMHLGDSGHWRNHLSRT